MIEIYVEWVNKDEMKKYIKEGRSGGEGLEGIKMIEGVVVDEREGIGEGGRKDDEEREISLFEEEEWIE